MAHMGCAPEQELFREERLKIHKLLADNPNYFGTAANADLPVVQPIKFNTAYEELTCIGLWPERNLLEATIVVKLPFGFLSDMCSPGSYEYVRFFIDWDNDGDFDDFNEDVGLAKVNVHDIPQVKEHHLCYAVRRRFRPFLANCKDPYIVKLRAILSWEYPPPPGNWNFPPIWGNVLECWIQIDPVEGKVLGIVTGGAAAADAPPTEKGEKKPKQPRIEKERLQFLELLEKNPNYFGTLPISDLKPVLPLKYDTRYEELKCIGLYPERNFLEAIIEVKLPYGFLGDLCSPGSREYVRFFIDWNGDGDFVDFNDDVGVVELGIHDIPQVREHRLCYAVGRRFRPLPANCQQPYIVRVRAILSWQIVPTGPNFIPPWGNVVECWVQVKPTVEAPALTGIITSPAAADPIACVSNQPILSCGLTGVTIVGTAGGTGFTSYRIEYRPLASFTWVQLGVVYPDCTPASTTPDHATPRFSAPLAYLTDLPTGAYAVRLRVDGAGGPVFAFTSFSLQYRAAVIDWIGAVVAREMGPHPADPTEALKLIRSSAVVTDPDSSVGGTINVWGSADFDGCDRRMIEYVLQYREVVFPAIPWERDAAGPWTDVKPPLPFGGPGDPVYPREYDCWQGGLGGSLVTRPNYVRDNYLTRIWNNHTCLLSPLPLPDGTTHVVRRTEVSAWNTLGLALNGRFTVRLRLRHRDLAAALPVEEIYDAATVWLDNRQIQVFLIGLGITGGAPLGVCVELSLSQFLGTTADVRGRAWDPLILNTIPAAEKPNDNFDYYTVTFRKAGGPTYHPIITGTTRVPNVLPVSPPGDVGTLAAWNIISALDAGPAPTPYVDPPDPKIYRGERCAYLIHLYATDKTLINDGGDTHDGEDFFPFCIVNDLT